MHSCYTFLTYITADFWKNLKTSSFYNCLSVALHFVISYIQNVKDQFLWSGHVKLAKPTFCFFITKFFVRKWASKTSNP